jgi:hypothetical protein
VIDGTTRVERHFKPVGARGDRPPYVLEDLQLAPGPHSVSLTFEPRGLGAAAKQTPGLELNERFRAVRGRIHLITFEPKNKRLVLH